MFFSKKPKATKLGQEQERLKKEYGDDFPLMIELYKEITRVYNNKEYAGKKEINTKFIGITLLRIQQNFGRDKYEEFFDFRDFADVTKLYSELASTNFAPKDGFQLYDTKLFTPKVYLGSQDVKLICTKCNASNSFDSERCCKCGTRFYPPIKRMTVPPYSVIK